MSDLEIVNRISDIIRKKILKQFGRVVRKDNASYVNHYYKNGISSIKPMKWPNERGHKTTSANRGNPGKRQDKMEVLCKEICARILTGLWKWLGW